MIPQFIWLRLMLGYRFKIGLDCIGLLMYCLRQGARFCLFGKYSVLFVIVCEPIPNRDNNSDEYAATLFVGTLFSDDCLVRFFYNLPVSP